MGKYEAILSECRIWRLDILIFVTLGTQDKPFTRLLEALEKEIEKGNITDEVIVQAGSTKYKSKKMQLFDLISQETFSDYMQKADIIITHGGVGSIVTALNFEKKVIAAPRLAQFGEHVNDHQLQIIKCFEQKNYILPLYDFEKLNEVIEKSKTFIPSKFISNRDNFLKFIERLYRRIIIILLLVEYIKPGKQHLSTTATNLPYPSILAS